MNGCRRLVEGKKEAVKRIEKGLSRRAAKNDPEAFFGEIVSAVVEIQERESLLSGILRLSF